MERPLTQHMRKDREPLSIDDYERAGGYQALRRALQEMSRSEINQEVLDANLRGRGGAGFPTGAKWASVPTGDHWPSERFFVADADEMEPGTFKDRMLLEGNPHQFLEGLIIGSYAVDAAKAFIFIRWEYKLAAQRLRTAIQEAHARGYIGERILGTDFSLDVHLHVSAGRYICGEASALLSSLEGGRAVPRAKPPREAESGLWGKPTVLDNVETLVNVPHIIKNGAAWFKGLSLCNDGGTKIYGVSGRVKNPGLWELPMGTNLREIIEDHAGGMRDGFKLRAVIPGGASTEFLMADEIDIPMDFDTVQKAGSRFGTANVIVLDDRTCPVGVVANLIRFFAQESCGWCTPCREGLPWLREILDDIEHGRGREEDLDILQSHTRLLWLGHTFCALAPGAMEPLKSALKHFRDDFERHVKDGRCPWR